MTPVAYVVLASLVGNLVLGCLYLDQRDEVTLAASKRDDAVITAQACSSATGKLRDLAAERAKQAASARRQAAGVAATHNQRADQILAAPPAVPGNACASAQAQVDGWLQGRAKQ